MTTRKFSTCFSAITVMLIFFLQHHLVDSLSPNQQKVALFQFKQSLNIIPPTHCYYYYTYTGVPYPIPSYPKTMNWSMSSDHCTWEGVSCDHETGHVIGLDLSCSGLEGAILPNSTLFQLSHLHFLNLSNNDFSRSSHFPQEFGSFAKGLNLSCNQLSGHIPLGSQFNTFNNDSYVGNLGLCGDNDSYVGNLGLCGFPLSKACEHDIKTPHEGEGDDYFFSGFTWEAVVIGYGCGVVPAFIIGNLMLLAGKPKWFAAIIARELGLKIRRMEIKWR